jgi:hypothetical protein
MIDDPVRILIVEGRFYNDLSDELLRGATDAIQAFGAEYDVITVPGALEIPGVIALADDDTAEFRITHRQGYDAHTSRQLEARLLRTWLDALATGNVVLLISFINASPPRAPPPRSRSHSGMLAA